MAEYNNEKLTDQHLRQIYVRRNVKGSWSSTCELRSIRTECPQFMQGMHKGHISSGLVLRLCCWVCWWNWDGPGWINLTYLFAVTIHQGHHPNALHLKLMSHCGKGKGAVQHFAGSGNVMQSHLINEVVKNSMQWATLGHAAVSQASVKVIRDAETRSTTRSTMPCRASVSCISKDITAVGMQCS